MNPRIIFCAVILSAAMPVLAQQPDSIRVVTAAPDIIPGEMIRVELGGTAGAHETASTRVMIDGQLAPTVASSPGVLNVLVPGELYEGRAELKVVRGGRDEMTDVPIYSKTLNVSTPAEETIASSTFTIRQRSSSARLSRSLSIDFGVDSNRDPFPLAIDKVQSERMRRSLAVSKQLPLSEVSRTTYRIATETAFSADATVEISLPDDLVSAQSAGKTIEAYESRMGCGEFLPLGAKFDAATNELLVTLNFSRLKGADDQCGDGVSTDAPSTGARRDRSLQIAFAVK